MKLLVGGQEIEVLAQRDRPWSIYACNRQTWWHCRVTMPCNVSDLITTLRANEPFRGWEALHPLLRAPA